MTDAPAGRCGRALYRQARELGGLVAQGALPPELAFMGLAAAAERAGLPAPEAAATLRAGLLAGEVPRVASAYEQAILGGFRDYARRRQAGGDTETSTQPRPPSWPEPETDMVRARRLPAPAFPAWILGPFWRSG